MLHQLAVAADVNNLHSDGTHPRTTTTVRYTESLVEIEMGNIRSIITRTTQSNLSVHVCTIQIDLSTVTVDQVQDFPTNLINVSFGRIIGEEASLTLLQTYKLFILLYLVHIL